MKTVIKHGKSIAIISWCKFLHKHSSFGPFSKMADLIKSAAVRGVTQKVQSRCHTKRLPPQKKRKLSKVKKNPESRCHAKRTGAATCACPSFGMTSQDIRDLFTRHSPNGRTCRGTHLEARITNQCHILSETFDYNVSLWARIQTSV